MKYMLAAIGPVTTAVRLRKVLLNEGIRDVRVVSTPAEINKGGCSYSLKFSGELRAEVERAARRGNLIIKGFYTEKKTGEGSEYYAVP